MSSFFLTLLCCSKEATSTSVIHKATVLSHFVSECVKKNIYLLIMFVC
jgi:hypothetical protein